MDHLVCFLPGLIALGVTQGHTLSKVRTWPSWDDKKEGQIQLARDLMKTCWGMYTVTKTGLAPEIAWFHAKEEDLHPAPGDRPLAPTKDSLAAWRNDYIVKPLDAHNLQRPETVESLFVMWRITEDPLYREWGWKIFQAFEKHTKVGENQGHTSVNNVNAIPPPLRDNMESFWLVSHDNIVQDPTPRRRMADDLWLPRQRHSNTYIFYPALTTSFLLPKWCSTRRHIFSL